MKTILTATFLFCACVCNYAQTLNYNTLTHVLTCNGTPIEARIASYELTAAQKATAKADFLTTFAYLGITSADIIDDAAYSYNCHAYAWHLREGYTNKVWINQTIQLNPTTEISNLSLYWSEPNPCFVTTTEALAEKIFYYAGDHSAVKSSVSGKYESKWGQAPVVRHNPTQVPSGYAPASRRYYKKPSLSVPEIYSITGPTSHQNGQYADYQAVLKNGSPTPTNYQWILNPTNGNNLYGTSSSTLTVAFYNAGSYQIVCRAAGANGWGPYTTINVQVYNPGSYSAAYPNPVSSTLNVSFDQALVAQAKSSVQATGSSQSGKAFVLSIKLYNSNGVLQRQTTTTGQNITLDVSGLPEGLYFLHVHDGIAAKPEIHKILIER
ncbi:MAG: T9SS type A sorting domain-containing protein [Tannerellaceae bacterium]|jgi:hypothetical protein|nr:T9SS type A sorting domain-containing protein [Tannerellaceae bacterium]